MATNKDRPEPAAQHTARDLPTPPSGPRDSQLAIDVCPHCSESVNLALIKGCLRCMKCGFKWDCNGW